MAQRRHRNAGQSVEILLALGIRNPTTASVTESDRQPCVGIHDVRHRDDSKNENGGHRRPNQATSFNQKSRERVA
jgi:hypothetical protein